MPYPGSIDTVTLVVETYDVTTLATVSVEAPNGTTITPTATSIDHATWTANPTYTQTGKWVATWTVTNTGAGVTQQDIWVSTLATGAAAVAWRPELWNVAAYVPRRTLVGAVDGYGITRRTFDNDTHPSKEEVHLLITDACAWVQLLVASPDVSLYGSAMACAAVYAASSIELGYPDNRDDLTVADALLQRATAMRADLDRANAALTGEDPENPDGSFLFQVSFPPDPVLGDLDL